jgi:hypothetical protein
MRRTSKSADSFPPLLKANYFSAQELYDPYLHSSSPMLGILFLAFVLWFIRPTWCAEHYLEWVYPAQRSGPHDPWKAREEWITGAKVKLKYKTSWPETSIFLSQVETKEDEGYHDVFGGTGSCSFIFNITMLTESSSIVAGPRNSTI